MGQRAPHSSAPEGKSPQNFRSKPAEPFHAQGDNRKTTYDPRGQQSSIDIDWSNIPTFGHDHREPEIELSQTSRSIAELVRKVKMEVNSLDEMANAAYYNDPEAIKRSLADFSVNLETAPPTPQQESHQKLKEKIQTWNTAGYRLYNEGFGEYTANRFASARKLFALAAELYRKAKEEVEKLPGFEFTKLDFENFESKCRDSMEGADTYLKEFFEKGLRHEIQTGKYTIEGYTNLELLGEGNCGVVFKGYDRDLKRYVALKVQKDLEHMSELSNADEQYYATRGEAIALAQMKSPNVLSVYNLVKDSKGNEVMAMEFVQQGKDLTKHREGIEMRGERLSFDEVVMLVKDMAKGIKDMHAQGIIHRDIKPDNVMVEGESSEGKWKGICKIGDPGIAISTKNCDGTESPSGTPVYMCNEAFRAGTGDALTPKVDVYALGLTSYYLLTGKTPDKALKHAYAPRPVGNLNQIALAITTTPLKNGNPTIKLDDPALKDFQGGYRSTIIAYGKKVFEEKKKIKVENEAPKDEAKRRFCVLLRNASCQDLSMRPDSTAFVKEIEVIEGLLSEHAERAHQEQKKAKSERKKAQQERDRLAHEHQKKLEEERKRTEEIEREVEIKKEKNKSERIKLFQEKTKVKKKVKRGIDEGVRKGNKKANMWVTVSIAAGLGVAGILALVALNESSKSDLQTAKAIAAKKKIEEERAEKNRIKKLKEEAERRKRQAEEEKRKAEEEKKKEEEQKNRLEKMNTFFATVTTGLENKQSELAGFAKQDLKTALSRDWNTLTLKIDQMISEIEGVEESDDISVSEKVTVTSLRKTAESIRAQYGALEAFKKAILTLKNIKLSTVYDIEYEDIPGLKLRVLQRYKKSYLLVNDGKELLKNANVNIFDSILSRTISSIRLSEAEQVLLPKDELRGTNLAEEFFYNRDKEGAEEVNKLIANCINNQDSSERVKILEEHRGIFISYIAGSIRWFAAIKKGGNVVSWPTLKRAIDIKKGRIKE